MTTLVVGASGATGKLLVEQLLNKKQKIKVIVRSSGNIPDLWINNENVEIIKSDITETGLDEMADLLINCQAVASCLGHNLTLKGIFGKPRKLVTGAVSLLCEAIKKNAHEKPVKFVLMNTTGNRNRDLDEKIPSGQNIIMGLFRLVLPPQRDNEDAADYLRVNIGQNNPNVEWTAVRPDSLINEEKVTGYSLHISPARNPVFNPGKTSRVNVADFMARLINENDLWNEWKGQMPVIYNITE